MIVTLIEKVYSFLWGDLVQIPLPGGSTLGISLLIILLIPTGIYFTVRTRFLPIRLFPDMVQVLVEKKAEWYKDNKETADLQRDLDEQGIGDLIEDDTEEANFQAVYNGEYYEIECIDISGLEEDAEVHLKNGDEIEVKEIIDILEKRKNSKADKEFEEELDNCLLRNVKGYTIS